MACGRKTSFGRKLVTDENVPSWILNKGKHPLGADRFEIHHIRHINNGFPQ